MDSAADKLELIDMIQNILKTNYDFTLEQEQFTKSFFDLQINLSARAFIDLIFLIEEKLGITFTEDDLLNPHFVSMSGIAQTCLRRLKC